MSDDSKLAVELVELERSRLGNELHDGVIPLLFVASSTVTNLRDKLALEGQQAALSPSQIGVRSGLDQVAQWLDEAMQASRRLLTETYPPDLDHCDWQVAADETLLRLFPEWTDRVSWDLDPKFNIASQPVACAVYRIVLEAIRNACQHGEATEVVVSGRSSEKALEVAICDNGIGFEPSQVPSNHFGIRAMHCRAELISGTLRIDSEVGGPTTVVLVVPVAD